MSWKNFNIELAAGESQPVHQPGEWVALRESTGELQISSPTGDTFGTLAEGERVRLARFPAIMVRNAGTSTITADLIISDEEFISAPAVTLSSSTPAESLWSPDVAGEKPRVVAEGKLYTYNSKTIFSAYFRDEIGSGLELSTSYPSFGAAGNRVQKRAGYHQLINENALFHGLPSEHVAPFSAGGFTPASAGYFSGWALSNKALSGKVIVISSLFSTLDGLAYIQYGNYTTPSGTVLVYDHTGLTMSNDKYFADSLGAINIPSTQIGQAQHTTASDYINSADVYTTGLQQLNLSQKIVLRPGQYLIMQNQAVSTDARHRCRGWIVDQLAYDSVPDVETI